jgi:hypothetical protein
MTSVIGSSAMARPPRKSLCDGTITKFSAGGNAVLSFVVSTKDVADAALREAR